MLKFVIYPLLSPSVFIYKFVILNKLKNFTVNKKQISIIYDFQL